ncbi:MAG: hemolysin family protein [Nitrospiraceae bacterium]|nr:hemolysin family protein [Nitrospiraceae bacterium]
MEPPSTLAIFVILFCVFLLALLSSSEASFISANRFRIRGLIEKGDKRARTLKEILDEHDRFFSAVVVSATLFTILATSLGTQIAISLFGPGPRGVVIITVVLTFVIVIFSELIPKTLAVTYADAFALNLARPVRAYMKLISPLVSFFSWIIRMFGLKREPLAAYMTVDEIKAMITIGEEAGAIEEEEKELLHRVFEFGDKMVSEVMVPRTEIVSIPGASDISQAMALVKDEGYSRYPVIGESIDEILGILYMKDILIKLAEGAVSESSPVTGIMREAYFVPENKMVSELLDEMQKRKFQIAVVMDEYGGTDGLITFEDIVEEIVGELKDEFEEIEAGREVEKIDERTFIVAGSASVDEVNELVGVELSSKDFHTIAGFVFGLFGRLPKVGEQVRFQDFRFLILEMEDRKIVKVKITKL